MDTPEQQTIRFATDTEAEPVAVAAKRMPDGRIAVPMSSLFTTLIQLNAAPEQTLFMEVPEPMEILTFADERIRVDLQSYQAFADDRNLELTPKELAIVTALARQAGVMVFRDSIATGILGYKTLDTPEQKHRARKHVDVQISNIRIKMGAELGNTKYGAIKTVRGLGYEAMRSLLPIPPGTDISGIA